MGSKPELTGQIVAAAIRTGFDRCAVASVQRLSAAPRLRRWLREERHAGMGWLGRDVERRTDPTQVVEGARSVLVVTRSYYTGHPATEDPTRGRISRFAWGDEYHSVMGRAIRTLYDEIQRLAPAATGRYYVDTGPVMEKAWAQISGLGWIGKHTNLVSVSEGSWFFLGAIILDLELDSAAAGRDHCGSCTACIDVCPTRAIVAPYVLDANLCISYLTIEHRGAIPLPMRQPIGNRIFGCDECQDVCPWNRFARVVDGAAVFEPREQNLAPRLLDLLALDEAEFRARFRDSPIRRTKYAGFLRNVAIALGNSGDRAAVPALAGRLTHSSPLVRSHCAWALGQLGGATATGVLERAAVDEIDDKVRGEISAALQCCGTHEPSWYSPLGSGETA